MMKHLLILVFILPFFYCRAQKTFPGSPGKIMPGAERMDAYLTLLKGRTVGIFANQTSMVGNTHLVDTLKKSGVNIKVIFGPEHGFRGTADAGEKVESTVDKATGIPLVSLYGKKRKPSSEDLKDVDEIGRAHV